MIVLLNFANYMFHFYHRLSACTGTNCMHVVCRSLLLLLLLLCFTPLQFSVPLMHCALSVWTFLKNFLLLYYIIILLATDTIDLFFH